MGDVTGITSAILPLFCVWGGTYKYKKLYSPSPPPSVDNFEVLHRFSTGSAQVMQLLIHRICTGSAQGYPQALDRLHRLHRLGSEGR